MTTDLTTVATVIFVAFSYTLILLRPDIVSKVILEFFSFFMPSNNFPATSFWNLLSQLKLRRRLMINVLVVAFFLVLILNVCLLKNFLPTNFVSNENWIDLAIILGFLLFSAYSAKEFFRIGNIEIPEIAHPKERFVNNIAENLSIAAGIKKPDIKIIGSTNPTAFAVAKFREYPSIYITTQLLHIADDLEIEAVIGHEISHIVSKRTQDFTIISILIHGLKVVSYFFFILVLLMIDPKAAAVWISIIVAVSARTLGAVDNLSMKEQFQALTFFVSAVNPPYVVLNFFVVTLYYFFTADEDLYADLMSIQLTRHTQGLNSILKKLKSYDSLKQQLPKDLAPLYFTSEAAPKGSTTIQPDIGSRLEVLNSIDSLIAKIEPSAEQPDIKCPYCDNKMVEVIVPTLYKYQVKVDRCPVCLSVWFDDRELWIAADLTTLNPSQENVSLEHNTGKPLLCPKCGVELQLLQRTKIPKIFQIFECHVCKGNFLHPKEIVYFGEFRKSWLEQEKKFQGN